MTGDWRRLLAAVTVALLAALLYAGSVRAQAEPEALTVDEYRARVATAQARLAGGGAKAVAQARAVLASIQTVELSTGAVVEVTPLLGTQSAPLTPEAAAARLSLVLAQLDASAGDDSANRLAILEEVLQRPEFALVESPWEQFWRWVDEQLARFLPQRSADPAVATATSQVAELVGWAVIAAGALAIVWLLAYWLRGLVLNMVADADARRQQAPDELPQTPGEARRRADSLALAGNYREAVRNLYLSALLTLEQHGLVTTDRSLTNREVLARVAPEHPIRPHLKPVVDTFDDVWYGIHEPDQGTFGTYSRAIDDLATLAAAKE